VRGLASAAATTIASPAIAQFSFGFGNSDQDGPAAPGIDLGRVFTGLTSLFEGLTLGEEDEIRLGNALYPRFIDRMGGAYRNRRAQTELRNFSEDILATTGRPNLQWEVTLLNNNTVNAWVLPGGKIGVNKGLLRYTSDEAELAAVLGHEIGHAELSHGLSQLKSESFTKGLTSLSREALAGAMGGDRLLSDTLIDALEFPLLQMVTTGYSEEREFEADQHLIAVFGNTGHDPSKAANFFRTLLEIMPPSQQATTSLYSTHPGTEERIRRIEAAASDLPSAQRVARPGGYAALKRTFPTRRHLRRRG
jgi:predicted Zn-dependent protease